MDVFFAASWTNYEECMFHWETCIFKNAVQKARQNITENRLHFAFFLDCSSHLYVLREDTPRKPIENMQVPICSNRLFWANDRTV